MVYYETSSEDDVNKLLSYGHPMIVKFYSPSCHHCKTIAPYFSSYAKANGVKLDDKRGQNKVLFLEVDATRCGKICSVMGTGIRGFPTIRAYKVGQKTHCDEQVGALSSQQAFYQKMDSMMNVLYR